MIASGFAGTLLGGRILDKVPERAFGTAFRVVLTIFALKLLWDGVSSW